MAGTRKLQAYAKCLILINEYLSQGFQASPAVAPKFAEGVWGRCMALDRKPWPKPGFRIFEVWGWVLCWRVAVTNVSVQRHGNQLQWGTKVRPCAAMLGGVRCQGEM